VLLAAQALDVPKTVTSNETVGRAGLRHSACLVGKDGIVGIDFPDLARFTRYSGDRQQSDAPAAQAPPSCTVGNARIVGIARIRYRDFEHVCEVCEPKCSD
jgi:hypothetical protein